jgi:3-deoxy-D-manno-octulosonic-acid transferase
VPTFPSLPPTLAVYRLLTGLIAPLVPGLLRGRARRAKEDAARLPERFGDPGGALRPDGPLVWLHGASVGESQLALALAARLREVRPDLAFLFTSGTVTSARLVGARLGARDLHRFVPVDLPDATARFMAHWRPDLGVLLEGEMWPNLVLAARAAGVPLALANARMTTRSVEGWARVPDTARCLFGAFAAILPADGHTASALEQLTGRALPPAGNLKLAAPVPQPDPVALASLRNALAGRPVWLAASTHPGEEEIALAVQASLQMARPDTLLILAPRHPDRALEVEIACRKAGCPPVRRSTGTVPEARDPVWLWDTLGELNLALALAPVTLMGGSLVPGIGGHNPVEPVDLGSAVISGLGVHNFADLYLALEAAGGAVLCGEKEKLALQVAGLMGDAVARERQITAARAIVAEGAGSMDRAVQTLVGLLPEART